MVKSTKNKTIWLVRFYMASSGGHIWEIHTDDTVRDKDEAIKLIQKGIMANITSPRLNDMYRFILKAKWRVDIGVRNSIRLKFDYDGCTRTMAITSHRKNYLRTGG